MTARESRILDNYSDPPDPPNFDYDEWFGNQSDLDYERMREDEVINGKTSP